MLFISSSNKGVITFFTKYYYGGNMTLLIPGLRTEFGSELQVMKLSFNHVRYELIILD